MFVNLCMLFAFCRHAVAASSADTLHSEVFDRCGLRNSEQPWSIGTSVCAVSSALSHYSAASIPSDNSSRVVITDVNFSADCKPADDAEGTGRQRTVSRVDASEQCRINSPVFSSALSRDDADCRPVISAATPLSTVIVTQPQKM